MNCKISIITLFSIISFSVFAEPPPDFDNDPAFGLLRQKFPSNDDEDSIRKFVEFGFANTDGQNDLDAIWKYLFANNRDEAIFLTAKVFHDSYPNRRFQFNVSFQGPFSSPVILALNAKKTALVRRLVETFPELASLPNRNAYGTEQRPPISFVIEDNDFALLKVFLAQKASLAYETVLSEENDKAQNLLSFSRSSEMDKLLLSLGIVESRTLQRPRDSQITSNSVRFRERASLDSPVISTLDRGTKIRIVGYEFRYVNLDGDKAQSQNLYNWIQVEVGGKIGWCYGKYVYFNLR